MFLKREMAEGGRDDFREARRENHCNMFKERFENVSSRVNDLQTAYYLLQGFTSVRLICPEYLSIIDELSSILAWVVTSISQEFAGDKEFLLELRRERDKLEEHYNTLWHFAPAFAEHVSSVIGRRGSAGFLEEEEDGGHDDN